jgi:hypothetical protein
MSTARDISRQSSIQTANLTSGQTSVTVTGGFSGSSIDAYLNGAKIVQGQDYTLNGTSGIVLNQGASADDIIEFVIRNTSNSGFSSANTGQIVDGAVTFDKLSANSSEDLNVKNRTAGAWIVFNGLTGTVNQNNVSVYNSFNISSVGDRGTGKYTLNFDTPFTDTHYAAVGMCGNYSGDISATHSVHQENTFSTSSFGLKITQNDSPIDKSYVSVIVFGEVS